MSNKICFVVNSLKKRSGVERVLSLLANYFSKEGVEITVLNRDTSCNETAFSIDKNVNIIKLDGNILNFAKKINNHLRDNKYDFIVVHNMGKLTPFFSVFKRSVSVVSLEHISFKTRPVWLKNISKIIYKNVNHVVTINSDDLISFKGIGCKNVSVIPNPSSFKSLSLEDLKINESKKVIAIGRLTYQKNFHALISAWQLLGNRTLGWNLEIYGDGEDKDSLVKLIDKYNLNNVCIKANTSSLDEVYKQAAFLVMSSRYEGFGMVLVEALSFGLPIISFNCPHGPSEIIDDSINGFLVDDQNIAELSKAMLRLIENPEVKNQLSQNALKSSYKYDIENIGKLWKKLFKDMVN